MASREPLIQVEHVSKKFCRDFKRSLFYGLSDLGSELLGRDRSARSALRKHEFRALDDVSLELRRGECLGLIGPNGSGKSSLLKLINGLMPPDSGSIRVRGRVGALIELTAGFNPILTGRENIYINASVLGMSKREVDRRFAEIVEFSEIGDAIDAPVQSYSSGMKARLGFSVAAHLDPDILLVDEVLAVGDVGFRMKCFQHLLRRKAAGLSIVLVTHSMIDVPRVCDRVAVLASGSKVHDGDVSEGITAYHAQLQTSEAGASPVRSSAAWIEAVELTDEFGRPKSDFQTGETLCAILTLAVAEIIEQARIVVHVEAPGLGVLGSFSTPYTGFSFDLTPPSTQVKLVLPEIPLLVGQYRFRFALYGPEITSHLDSWNGRVAFRVVGPPVDTFGFGLSHTFLFAHKWSIEHTLFNNSLV